MMDELEAAEKERLSTERRLGGQEARPYAIPCQFPDACSGAPMPTMLRSDSKTYLIFYLECPEGRIGQVEFHGTWCATIGMPDENAIQRHPLWGSGLDGYSPMEVINSDWIAELVRMVDRPKINLDNFKGRHFIIPFHDSTFECVAASYSVTELDLTHEEAVREAAALL